MTDKKIKVLCVEDEVDIRENLAGILESEEFEVLQAGDGNEGLEVFLQHNPDIIISDIMMPNFTGHDLLKAIRENNEIDNNNVPFILLTALGQKEDVIKGINMEASDYMVKPVDFDLLIAKIKEKTANINKTKEIQKKKIANLQSQVSNIVPNEMLQYVDLINKIAGVLKTEIYGPLPHKKYLEDINKIYIHSLKLRTMVDNFLSGKAISKQLDVSDEIIKPQEFLQNFINGLNQKFKQKITIDEVDEQNLFNIKINKNILSNVVKKIFGCIFKLKNETEIKISIAMDHLDRLVIIFCPTKAIDEDILRDMIQKVVSNDDLDSQGLIVEVLFSNDSTNVILTVPNYRVSNK